MIHKILKLLNNVFLFCIGILIVLLPFVIISMMFTIAFKRTKKNTAMADALMPIAHFFTFILFFAFYVNLPNALEFGEDSYGNSLHHDYFQIVMTFGCGILSVYSLTIHYHYFKLITSD